MIEIINRQKTHKINRNKYKKLLRRLVSHYELDNPEITLAIVNNTTIQELNRKFLSTNAPTDVLSFPVREKGPDGKFYLGDILISAQQAFHQAQRQGHSLDREIEELAIHGFLHLMGYEHSKGLEQEENTLRNLLLEGENGNLN